VFHISTWGGFEHCFGVCDHHAPVATGLASPHPTHRG